MISYPKSLPASYPGFKSGPPEELLDLGRTPYIVIHMGPQIIRGWIPEKWISVASALKVQGYELVATGGPGRDMEAARALGEQIPVRDLTGRLSWPQFVATVANAAAVVTIDFCHGTHCGMLRCSSGYPGRRPTTYWFVASEKPQCIMLTHSVGCAPCHRSNGCAAMACVRRIEVEDVLSSLQQAMKSRFNSLSQSAKPTTDSALN